MREEINKSLLSGAISKIDFNDSDLVSRIFLVPKSNGGHRMIIDLSNLNKFIKKSSFRMEDLSAIKLLILPNDYFVSIDMRDAFHSIPLHEESKKFTVFEFENSRYCFNVLPFGLTSSPRVFSKVLKPAIVFLRKSGLRIVSYLDDILICSNSLSSSISDRNLALELLSGLGFHIHFEKSQLVPVQKIKHLGYFLDSINMCFSLPEDKLSKIQSLALPCLDGPQSLRYLASLLGLMVSSSKGFRFAPLFYRKFQLNFLSGLKFSSNWETLFSLNQEAKLDLTWWLNASPSSLSPVPIQFPKSDLSMFSDASLSGWGSSLSTGESFSGVWSLPDSKEHINFLELKAIYLSILHFLPKLVGRSISFHCDNSCAVAYFNKIGGTFSKKLCFLSIDIWHLIRSSNFYCQAFFISGRNNQSADYLSRHSNLHEYSLSLEAFHRLINLIPFRLEIDLFASNRNKKLNTYVSIFLDSDALFVDAFSKTWPSNIYVFPPLPMVGRALMKVFRDQVNFCLFLTPAWISLPFIPLLKNALISNPIFIPSSHLLGTFPTRYAFPLMAWPISSPYARKKVIPRKFQLPSSKESLLRPSKPILGSGLDLWDGLIKENILPLFLQN